MDDTAILHVNPLRLAKTLDEYNLYKAALEWQLPDPVVIDSREDLVSETRWSERIEPYPHQIQNLMAFCRRQPISIIADDIGLGKMISACLITSELIARGRVSKILVICPKHALSHWREELEKKFGIPAEEIIGNDLQGMELNKNTKNTKVIITTYRSANLHFDSIIKMGFEMLILDEAHELCNLYGGDKPSQIAKKLQQALADQLFKYVLMLTATPIQKWLWDIYSLIDLAALSRGQLNPLGTPEKFAEKYFNSDYSEATQLNSTVRDEFRDIIYGYMSRIKRGDDSLDFPERTLQFRQINPSQDELALIDEIVKSIKALDADEQAAILQALLSSPQALATQLKEIAYRTKVYKALNNARTMIQNISHSTKLEELTKLINVLQQEQGDQWRVVIFTAYRETQINIEKFLTLQNITCALINSDTGLLNQQTIEAFRLKSPKVNVIICTDEGSEGLSLHAANVLINFDFPWDPMIIEQRISRIQRLTSLHKTVTIFNLIFRDTVEDIIVRPFIEQLLIPSHSMSDIESLLELIELTILKKECAADYFCKQIRKLVLAHLAGNEISQDVKSVEKMIDFSRKELEFERKKVDAILGEKNEIVAWGSPCPKLPAPQRSMDSTTFSQQALLALGQNNSLLLSNKSDIIILNDLANQIAATKICLVNDKDQNLTAQIESLVENWVTNFGGIVNAYQITHAQRFFTGTVLVRVNLAVARDNYERLIEISCTPDNSDGSVNINDIEPLNSVLNDISALRLSPAFLITQAMQDPEVSKFREYYLGLLAEKSNAADLSEDEKHKIEQDYKPKVEIILASVNGALKRDIKLLVNYKFESGDNYESALDIVPSTNEILQQPEMEKCLLTGNRVPTICLGQCQITGHRVLKHKLERSELSNRTALPEFVVTCGLSGKRVLKDEVELSAITGQLIISHLLKTSEISGKRAEPEFFDKCEFTLSEILKDELATSQISEKRYRKDEQMISAISGKIGHKAEFIICSETAQPILPVEAERCDVTGKIVIRELLSNCEVTGRKVLQSELDVSALSGIKALKSLFVTSNISSVRLLEQEAIKSSTGQFCAPSETKSCFWSGKQFHPADLHTCQLTGQIMGHEYVLHKGKFFSSSLIQLLEGKNKKMDKSDRWSEIEQLVASTTDCKQCKVQAAELSPDGKKLAVCLEVKMLMGMKVRHAGFIYSLEDKVIVGKITMGKRTKG